MPNLMTHRSWIDDIDDEDASWAYTWGPDGFGHPDPGYWRDRNGTQVRIEGMTDSYLNNCIKFLEKVGTSSTEMPTKSWPIYKSLADEAMKRGIDGRTDWDE